MSDKWVATVLTVTFSLSAVSFVGIGLLHDKVRILNNRVSELQTAIEEEDTEPNARLDFQSIDFKLGRLYQEIVDKLGPASEPDVDPGGTVVVRPGESILGAAERHERERRKAQ